MRHGHMTCTILYKNGTISTPCSAMSKYFVKHCCHASGLISTLEDKCNHLSQNKITFFLVSTVKIQVISAENFVFAGERPEGMQ